MGEFEKASKTIKTHPLLINLALAFLTLANLLNLIAFSTTSWGRVFSISGGGFHGFGLWRICSSGTQSFSLGAVCADTSGWPQDWYGATQCFAIFGFLGITGGLILLLIFLCLKQCKGNISFLFGTAIFIITAGIFYLIGIIIFGVEFDNIYAVFVTGFGNSGELSWSFALAIVADICGIVAGILLLMQSRNTRSTSPDRKKLFKQPSNSKKAPEHSSPKEKRKHSVPSSNKNQNVKQNQNQTTKPVNPPPAKSQPLNNPPPTQKEQPIKQQDTNHNKANTHPNPVQVKPNKEPPKSSAEQTKANQAQPKPANQAADKKPAAVPQPVKSKNQPRKSVTGQPNSGSNANQSPEAKRKKTSSDLSAPAPVEVSKPPQSTTVQMRMN